MSTATLKREARQKLAGWREPKAVPAHDGEASFGACAEHLIASLRPSWRTRLHASSGGDGHCKDAARLAPIPVDKITTEDVLAVLAPMWQTKRTTANACAAASSACSTPPRRAG